MRDHARDRVAQQRRVLDAVAQLAPVVEVSLERHHLPAVLRILLGACRARAFLNLLAAAPERPVAFDPHVGAVCDGVGRVVPLPDVLLRQRDERRAARLADVHVQVLAAPRAGRVAAGRLQGGRAAREQLLVGAPQREDVRRERIGALVVALRLQLHGPPVGKARRHRHSPEPIAQAAVGREAAGGGGAEEGRRVRVCQAVRARLFNTAAQRQPEGRSAGAAEGGRHDARGQLLVRGRLHTGGIAKEGRGIIGRQQGLSLAHSAALDATRSDPVSTRDVVARQATRALARVLGSPRGPAEFARRAQYLPLGGAALGGGGVEGHERKELPRGRNEGGRRGRPRGLHRIPHEWRSHRIWGACNSSPCVRGVGGHFIT